MRIYPRLSLSARAGDRNSPDQIFAILAEDELETQTYTSLFRVLERAPMEKKLRVFRLAAKFASEQIAVRRQQAIEDLWAIAEELGLIELHGVLMVQDALSEVWRTA